MNIEKGRIIIDHFVGNQKVETEPLGLQKKFWFKHNNKHILWKKARTGSFEDCASIVVGELLKQMNYNVAEYYLANYDDENGVITPDFKKADEIEINAATVINYTQTKSLELKNPGNTQFSFDLFVKGLNAMQEDGIITDEFNKSMQEYVLTLIMFDAKTMQADRNASNCSFLLNLKTMETRIVSFDNGAVINLFEENLDLNKLNKQYQNDAFNLAKLIGARKPKLCLEGVGYNSHLQNVKEVQTKHNKLYLKANKKLEKLDLNKAFESADKSHKTKLPNDFKQFFTMCFTLRSFELDEISSYTPIYEIDYDNEYPLFLNRLENKNNLEK